MTRAAENEIRSKVRARLRSSTLRGVGRLLDFGGTYREDAIRAAQERAEQSRKARKTPAEAVAADWERVGSYLRSAMRQFEAEHGKHE